MWIAPVRLATSAWSADLARSALLPSILSPAGSLQSFSQGVFLSGFLFLRVVLPGALFSSVQFSTLLFPLRGSPWNGSPPVHPQRSSTACVSLLCGSPSSFLSVAQGAGLHGRACGPHAASTRSQKPRQIHAALSRLHLRLAAKTPSSFRCGPIFIPLRFHIHSVAAAPSSFRRPWFDLHLDHSGRGWL